jgi:hypothetical protein
MLLALEFCAFSAINHQVQRPEEVLWTPEYIVLDFCFKNFGRGCNLRWAQRLTNEKHSDYWEQRSRN